MINFDFSGIYSLYGSGADHSPIDGFPCSFSASPSIDKDHVVIAPANQRVAWIWI